MKKHRRKPRQTVNAQDISNTWTHNHGIISYRELVILIIYYYCTYTFAVKILERSTWGNKF